MSVLFLLAHPDDEFGCFESLRRVVASGGRAVVVYLTDGGSGTGIAMRRSDESRAVLGRLGISSGNLHFIGAQNHLPDGGLHRHLMPAWEACLAFCATQPAFDSIYMPAWEGGHPDHDAVHLLGVLLGRRLGISRLFQFPLYNARAVPKPFFRVLDPLAGNGTVQRLTIRWADRFRYLRLCLSYPSQWKTWVGLLPFVAPKLLLGGSYALQRAGERELSERPHDGPLLYESRGWLSWQDFCTEIQRFLFRLPSHGQIGIVTPSATPTESQS
ncbi:PIG-L deacetylase family protein [Cupriavidus sp. USMAHM13]|uniref:PIG-L deacetylase family protein n=1 Tax=Cupriavidus sp. USMAHM13 TaxID=1389192 RepID=UPI0018D2A73B|nr:PIG-L family deacetylase [Cupriavidus sp. USMAHM13]